MIRPIETFSLSLDDAAALVGATIIGDGTTLITGATHRDSDVELGDLFIAIPGAKVHGATFAESAAAFGAVAVITDAVASKAPHCRYHWYQWKDHSDNSALSNFRGSWP